MFGGFAGFTSGSSAPLVTAPPKSIFAFLSQDKKPDNNNITTPTSTNGTTPKEPEKAADNKTYHQKLSALNKSLCQWISKHVEDNPICILTPVFKDYEKHLLEIQESPKVGITGGSTAAPPVTKTTFQGFSFGGSGGSAAATAATSPPKTSSPFTLGGPAAASANPAADNSTKSSPLVASATTGFSFGGAKPFSFGNTGPVAPATPKESTEEGNDDDDEPPKVEFKAVVEEDSVFSKRCKVFFKVDSNFQERGIGTIFVKPIKDSAKHQMIVRADTSLGNILVNVVLVEGLPVKRMGSNNVMLVCVPNTDFDKPVSVLFKVKTAADADEVVAKLGEFTKE